MRYVGLPGGDRAAREPWRMAVAHLVEAGVEVDERSFEGVSRVEMRAIRKMLEQGMAPRTSSVGRMFDAAAAIAGIHPRVAHEAQAAMELQCVAERCTEGAVPPYGFEIEPRDGMLEIDPRQLFRELANDVARRLDTAIVARRFHVTLAAMTTAACVSVRTASGISSAMDVVLTGGVFANALLVRDTGARLRDAGFRVHVNRAVPTNDGGLAFGQLAAIAATDRA